jgi:hypothetical protein
MEKLSKEILNQVFISTNSRIDYSQLKNQSKYYLIRVFENYLERDDLGNDEKEHAGMIKKN